MKDLNRVKSNNSRMRTYLMIGIVIVLGIVAGSVTGILYGANAQVEPTNRIFEKDFCESEESILSDILYNDLSQLSYDSQGCPVSVKIIRNWDGLSVSSQNLITNRLALNGYIDTTVTNSTGVESNAR